MKISALKFNSARIEAGAWVASIPGLPGVAFRVRGIGCTASRDLRARLIAEIPRLERIKGVSAEAQERIETEDLVENILLDWSGIDDDEGGDGVARPLPWSKAVARRYLENPDYAMLRGGVLYAAQVVADIGTDELEADRGN